MPNSPHDSGSSSDGGSNGGKSAPGNGAPVSVKSKTSTAAIVGGVVGGVVAIAIIAILVLFCRRRRNSSRFKTKSSMSEVDPFVQYANIPLSPTTQSTLVPQRRGDSFSTNGDQYTEISSMRKLRSLTPTTPTSRLSPTSFSSPSQSSSAQGSVGASPMLDRRTQIQTQIREIQTLLARNEISHRPRHDSLDSRPQSNSTGITERSKELEYIEGLQRRIALLEQENAALASSSQPPAYGVHSDTPLVERAPGFDDTG